MDRIDEFFAERYAFGKLTEFVRELFISLKPARESLSNNFHFVAIIQPTDFKQERHQKKWSALQKSLRGKTKNIGLDRSPIDRLTVHNKTLEAALSTIWDIYEECCTCTAWT